MIAKLRLVALTILFTCVHYEASVAEPIVVGKLSNKSTLTIFVDGLTGNAFDTWLNKETNKFWPQIMRSDSHFDHSDVLVYEYPSKIFSDGYGIDGLAEMLGTDLLDQSINIRKYDHILVIAHSLGGIVTAQAILRYPELMQRVKGVFMFGTPWDGSYLADIVRVIGAGNLVSQLRQPRDGNKFLESIRDSWRDKVRGKIKIKCAYEKVATGSKFLGMIWGEVVVPKRSVDKLCDERATPIDANHINMVKPGSQDSFIHKVVRRWHSDAAPR